MNEWINVKDRLPDKTGCYLVFYSRGKSIDVSLFKNEKWCEEWGNHIITHWMPLPKPPKESDNS